MHQTKAKEHHVSSVTAFFGNKFIRIILLSNLFAQIGIWTRNFAVLLFVMEMTNNDAVAVSWIYVAEFAPILVFSFIGGAYADRWRPKRTMIGCDLLSALSVFAILIALIAGVWEAIFLTTLLSAILSQFSQPSGMKLFKLHVPDEQVQSGMAMYQSMIAVFAIIGPVLGTFAFTTFGIHVSIALVGIAFLLSALSLVLMPSEKQVRMRDNTAKQTHVWQEIKDGFKYVYNHPVLRLLGIAFALGGLAVGIIQPLGIFLVVDQLHLDKEYYQWFAIANGAATIIGGALVVVISKRLSSQQILAVGNLVSAFSVIGLGLSTVLYISMFMQFLRGFVLPFIQVGIHSIVIKTSDESYVGRVNGVFGPVFIGCLVLMTTIAGWLSTFIPLVTMFLISGLLFFTAVAVIRRMFRLELKVNPIVQEHQSG